MQRCLDQWNLIGQTYTDTCGLFQNNTPEVNVQVLFFFCRVKRSAFARNDSWSWKLSKAMKLDCGRRLVPGVWYSFLLLNRVVLLPFMVFGLLTVFPQGWRLSKAFECRLLFRVFPFLGMSEEVLLDGVNVMCKDVWTNETWLDCCILTLLFLLNIVLCSGC